MSDDQTYIGQELTLFAHATNWKKYYASIIQPYFGSRVVEVGAGIGATTAILCDGTQDEWICLEPDKSLRSDIDRLISEKKLPACCQTIGGFVVDIPSQHKIDTFIYIDVLEHIEDDAGELEQAATRLTPGGRLIVLSPAFNLLYSPFDRAIGHFRRYNKKTLRAITPPRCKVEKMIYLDSVGVATSLLNRVLLSQALPTIKQIKFWDSHLVPISRLADSWVRYGFGRSILSIWVKT